MSSMTAGRIVQPTTDHSITKDGDGLVYNARTRSIWRVRALEWLGLPLLLLGAFLLLWGVSAHMDGGAGGPLVLLGLACWGGTIVLMVRANSDAVVPIHFDDKAITVGGNSYLLDHVLQVGWRASSGFAAYGNLNVRATAKRNYMLSGIVFIKYGAKEIPLVTGLHPDKVEGVYFDIQRSLSEVGRPYNV